MRWKFFRRYDTYSTVPWYLGLVKRDHMRLQNVTCPIPFSTLFAAIYYTWRFLRFPAPWFASSRVREDRLLQQFEALKCEYDDLKSEYFSYIGNREDQRAAQS